MEDRDQNNQVSNETNNFEEVPVYQEVETKKKEVRTDSYFDGGVLELIGWRILACLISTITLGIATPWAQCMLYAWQFKHTVYNGKRLKFEGTGGDLFVNIFKWIFFSIITLGIYIFFIPVKRTKWVISNLHFENEEFNKDESFFDGNTLQLIGINILSKLMTVCSLGLLYPIITFGIFLIWMPIIVLKWESKHIHIKTVGEEEKKDYSLLIIIPIVLVLTIIMGIVLINVISNISSEDLENLKTEILNKAQIKDNTIESVIDDNFSRKEESKTLVESNEELDVDEPVEEAPKKTLINVGGYTLKFGTYKGIIEQGVWDEETMTATSKKTNIVLKLSENSITINGESGSYSVSGNNIIWNGNYYLLEVTGNNKIRYNAETCPELIYQGY